MSTRAATSQVDARARRRRGCLLDLPITSSAADASSSATATSVTCMRAAEGVVRAAQVDHGGDAGHADGHVGQAAAPRCGRTCRTRSRRRSTPRLARSAVADAPGRPVAVDGRSAASSPVSTFDRSTPAVGAHEAVAGLGDDEVAPAAQDPHGLRLDDGLVRRADRRGRSATSRSSAFDTIFCVTTSTSPSTSGPLAVPAQASAAELAELVARTDLAHPLDAPQREPAHDAPRPDRRVEHRPPPARRRPQACRMTVSVTTQRTPFGPDLGARGRSASSMTSGRRRGRGSQSAASRRR